MWRQKMEKSKNKRFHFDPPRIVLMTIKSIAWLTNKRYKEQKSCIIDFLPCWMLLLDEHITTSHVEMNSERISNKCKCVGRKRYISDLKTFNCINTFSTLRIHQHTTKYALPYHNRYNWVSKVLQCSATHFSSALYNFPSFSNFFFNSALTTILYVYNHQDQH